MTKHTYLKGVTTLRLNPEICVGCGICVDVCPHGVFHIEGGKARIEDLDGCMECGACALNCPKEAISVNANVGCAAAIIAGWFNGTETDCCCSKNECC
ncbi:MAG: 4Fe-4S binding protein [Synergistaceae bacterium]|jgi:NAD-dependent dihydropyrimidine dehydrogenase PreA subunit|nr:4Fe-4S binding protein [Synergistaceae bacterium]